MQHVARFAADDPAFERGQAVVVRSRRGTELGEVLAPAGTVASDRPGDDAPRLLRAAQPVDLQRAAELAGQGEARFAACLALFAEGDWPFQPIDAEPMLDDEARTVLQYLGPHGLDAEGLRERARRDYGLDLVLEAAGRDEPEPAAAEPPCERCGAAGGGGGCSTGGGDDHGGGGCSGCAVTALLARSRRR